MTAYLDLKKEPVRNMGNAKQILYSEPLLVPFVRLKTMASLGTTPLPCPVEAIQTPVMILQAGNDTIFPLEYIESIYQRLACPKRLEIYEGLARYMIVDDVQRFIGDCSQWLEDICSLEASNKV